MEESLKFLRERDIDKLLLKFFHQSEGFCEWDDESFERYQEIEYRWKLNFGLKNIHREPFVYDFDGMYKTKDILICNYGENEIRLGESHHDEISALNDEYIQIQDIVLYFNNRLVIDCSYITHNIDDENSYYIYKLREFHYTKELEDNLIQMSREIDVARIKEQKIEAEMFGDDKNSGKFTI